MTAMKHQHGGKESFQILENGEARTIEPRAEEGYQFSNEERNARRGR